VVTEKGHPLGFADSLLRNLLRGADFLPGAYAIGLLVMGRDPRFRRLGDLAAGTLVITEDRFSVAGPIVLDPPASPAEIRALPQRLPLSGEELDAVELFLRRAPKLSRGRELELAEMVAPVFARRIGIRYRDAPRFLAVIHHRAHAGEARGPFRQPQGRARQGAEARGGSTRSQDAFVAAGTADWKALDGLLLTGDALHRLDGASISRTAALYRSVCTDAMRVRAARYTPDLGAYLDGLAGRAHAALYGASPLRLPSVVDFFARDFPRALRQNGRFFLLACALFFLPFALGLAGALTSDDLAAKVIPTSMLEQMAHNYSKGFGEGRDAGTDTAMAGFYVFNNVGIAFRCFATGILFGAGSIFFLVYNGLVTGTVAGYVTAAGHGGNIWTFMCGHAPFELTAIVVAGGAGLQMGYALVDTGGLTRIGSLRRAAPSITRQILGAAAMLLVAALIEGFWSPSAAPPPVKWAASGVFTLLVILYLALAGRGGRPARGSAS
jgi:uncharacterized membrane protein SpoIIM required for sporulation